MTSNTNTTTTNADENSPDRAHNRARISDRDRAAAGVSSASALTPSVTSTSTSSNNIHSKTTTTTTTTTEDEHTNTNTNTNTNIPSTPFNASTTRHSIRMNKVTPETPNPVAVLSNVNANANVNANHRLFSSPSSAVAVLSHVNVNAHQNAHQNQHKDVLFVDMVDLKPECHRIVTPTTSTSTSTAYAAYCYPKLPLAYVQRKRLSDYLFSLTKEKEGLTDETAAILRDGRENDSDYWDVCIAELLTQVIVVLHCSSSSGVNDSVVKNSNSNSNSNEHNNNNAKDTVPSTSTSTAVTDHNRLGGLSRFLLQIGIA
eukprot:CAMPEP_0116033314 /NCGR_PEP_ID=MMETSP0321-20121206/18888_1 /TAXON_ID=163516 /ORGANISM="Leptocylindrus danicus var. danicus, Strain B650" /LENGTH=314 /DNA_ID=CAMNT_0003509311 /DNA_START=20 /DNA_END=960 /DNA_ORIENTATION=-